MATIIKDKTIIEADWERITLETLDTHGVPSAGKVMVPLSYWQAHRDILKQRRDGACVWLAAGEEPNALAADIAWLDTIGIDFPVYNDGRGYSCARELRQRYGFKGDLVAVGDVLRDQMFYMQRVGFNVFVPRSDRDINVALSGLFDFSLGLAYQGDTRDPRPIYRRWKEISTRFRHTEVPRKIA